MFGGHDGNRSGVASNVVVSGVCVGGVSIDPKLPVSPPHSRDCVIGLVRVSLMQTGLESEVFLPRVSMYVTTKLGDGATGQEYHCNPTYACVILLTAVI